MKQSEEKQVWAINGWAALALNLATLGAVAWNVYRLLSGGSFDPMALWRVAGFSLMAAFLAGGYFILQPNEAALLLLFGSYHGTVRSSGFHWANPFYNKRVISLRNRNFHVERLKVNDRAGNPIEIGAVVVWKVEDTAKATFDVVDYVNYIQIQSESAVRHLASVYPYDHGEEHEVTLRGGGDEICNALKNALQERLGLAGVTVSEARLTHLAYAPEIAQAMLRRQQASAVLAARQTIVLGAVGMVDLALRELASKNTVHLDDERKAAMVSNLLVVLCGETEATPVLNTGTLYN